MKKILIVFLLCFSFFFYGCDDTPDIVFEESIEFIDDANVINEYMLDNASLGGGKYLFIDLRGFKGVYNDYPAKYDYFSLRISVFKNSPWKNDDTSKEKLSAMVSNHNPNYPIVLMDYDGKQVNEAKDYLVGINFNNIKVFVYGMFDEENGYKAQMGEDIERYTTSGSEDCDC